MLPKKNRNDKEAVSRLFKFGSTVQGEILSFKFITSPTKTPARISFIVPKTLAKNSTTRNALRRKGYQAIKGNEKKFPEGFTGLFVFKKNKFTAEAVEEEIRKILSKVNSA